MLNIIIPIAGSSDFFEKSGYQYPKPLIEVCGKMMISHVIDNVKDIDQQCQVIFIIKSEDAIKYHLDNTLNLLAKNCKVIKIEKQTKGALCSVMLAIDLISPDDELLILNGDQIIEENYNTIYGKWIESKVDSGVVTFNSAHPRWSYVQFANNQIIQAAEKNPISNSAIAGYYYFSKAHDFFELSIKAIKDQDEYEGNFYLSAVINQYILAGKSVINFHIDKERYHSFYSPEMIKRFEKIKKY